MKKIILYVASSLDGYIALPDGSFDWLTEFPLPELSDYGYDEFIASCDTVIMGNGSYRSIRAMDVKWPYAEQDTYVVAHKPGMAFENVRFVTESPMEYIDRLRRGEGKDIFLVGGGKLLAQMFDARLVDEMRIFTIPIMLGNGIRLFPGHNSESRWRIEMVKDYDNGVVEVRYAIKAV